LTTVLQCSVDRLARACQTAGSTPLSLLTARAVRKAKVELLYSRDPIASIGYRLGFPNPGYFSQFFKRYTSYSPSEYRTAFGRPEADAVAATLLVTVEKISAE
jgi:AraC family transcriptional activator of pobA